MKKTFIILSLFLTLIALLSGCVKSGDPGKLEMPDDFAFSLSFGFEGKNNIDTYNGTFTKDLVSAGTETISFLIPSDEMKKIFESFVSNNIAGLPDDINVEAQASMGDTASSQTPAEFFTLTYTCNQETRTIVCNDGGPWDGRKGPTDSRNRLVTFVDYVREYVFSSDEYKEMSPQVGAYS